MSIVERRLRGFLLATSAAVAAGTLAELWLLDHTAGVVQLVPVGLALVVIGAVLLVATVAGRRAVLAQRVALVMVVLGSGYGVYQHVWHNFAFEREIRPNAPAREVAARALKGASPLMSPGVLALAAALGLAGTYGRDGDEERRAQVP